MLRELFRIVLTVIFIFNTFTTGYIIGNKKGNGAYCETSEDYESVLYCYNFQSFPTNLNSTKIETLDLNNNNNTLQKLYDGDLLRANLPNLRELYLSICNIQEIEKGAFRGGEKITLLWLINNKIEEIDPSVFSDLPNLEDLNLLVNPLKEFKKDSEFPELLNLERLTLDDCELQSLPKNLFKNLLNLEKLVLNGNQLTTLHHSHLQPLKNLKTLYLQSNNITRLDLSMFAEMPFLKSLSLNYNPPHKLGETGEFPELNLTSLHLINCKLSEIKPNTFKNLKKLKNLHLQYNQLNNTDWINPLKSLEEIDLKGNRIEQPNLSVFANLYNLKRLDLSLNPIGKLKNNSEFPPMNLTSLSLRNCMLNSAEPSLFKNLGQLRQLDLSMNELASLDWRALVPLKDLYELNLHSNSWHCDCRIRSLLNFLEKRKLLQQLDYSGTPSSTCNSSFYDSLPNSNYSVVGMKLTEIDRDLLICPPEVTELMMFTTSGSNQSQSAVLRCKFSGYPLPELTWTRNGELLRNESGKIEISEVKQQKDSEEEAEFSNDFKQELIIIGPDINDEGNYECFASNLAGASSKSIMLKLTDNGNPVLGESNKNHKSTVIV